MTPSNPIPTTPAVYWRDFRTKAAPYIVFVAVLLIAIYIWNRRLGHATIVGRAETVHTPVSPRQSGVVVSLKVDLLQQVHKGDVIAEVVPADAEAVRAGMTANLESLRAQLLQTLDRNTVNFQQFRVDWLRRKLDLAAAQVDFQLAETDFNRIASLHENRIVSESDFDAKRSTRDALKVKVDTLTKLTDEMEHEMLQPRATDSAKSESPADRALAAATLRLEKELQAQADAAVVRAPMDGIVTAINRREGESIAAGEAVVTLGALHPTRIVAFERQPLRLHLRAGDAVQVASRGTRVSRPARIIRIGTQLESIESGLLPSTISVHVSEVGLPLVIEAPEALNLAPGEIVNIAAAAFR